MRTNCRTPQRHKLFFVFLLVVFGGFSETAQCETWQSLEYAPAPVDNPLKGLVPYQDDVRDKFPHSLEFNYVAYSKLVKGYDDFDWRPLESMLDDIASRGHQAVVRVFLEYPGEKGVIPEFLIRDGLQVHKHLNTDVEPAEEVETPDYEDKKLRRSLRNFVAAFGKKYDGDPRIGFITAGLLGTWGEWHTYPREDLFASKTVQNEVMTAYEQAFRTTQVLLRYPVGPDDDRAPNADRKFGYHDDSFAWATLHTGKNDDDWFYMTSLKAAGPAAEAKWKTRPIGGEIRPEAWGKVFDSDISDDRIQDFRRCVEQTHASWLMDSGMFEGEQSKTRVATAKEQVRRMGYEFHCPHVMLGQVEDGKCRVELEVENRGVAPFYYDWKVEWALLRQGSAVRTFADDEKLTKLLPGKVTTWSASLDVSELKAGSYVLGIRIKNPLEGAKPLRFANRSQDTTAVGWLTLGEMQVP